MDHDKGKISIQDIYRIDERSKSVIKTKYGHWDPKNGLNIVEPELSKRRSNLFGHELKYYSISHASAS